MRPKILQLIPAQPGWRAFVLDSIDVDEEGYEEEKVPIIAWALTGEDRVEPVYAYGLRTCVGFADDAPDGVCLAPDEELSDYLRRELVARAMVRQKGRWEGLIAQETAQMIARERQRQ